MSARLGVDVNTNARTSVPVVVRTDGSTDVGADVSTSAGTDVSTNVGTEVGAEVRADLRYRAAQLSLFRASALKQQKWRALSAALGELPAAFDGLDLGADTGVLSWLFRERGGRWRSAELGEDASRLIERMIGEPVARLDGARLPFASASFDVIVVIDLLEHLEDDRALLAELARCARPGARVVVNVPHRKRWAVLPPIRHALGLTDAWHGHRHAGYTARELAALLPPELRLVRARTYSRFFSHALDTALNWAFLRGAGRRATSTPKGMLVTGVADPAGRGASGGAFRVLAPVMRAVTALDVAIPWSAGYLLVATIEKGCD